ncbi:hypothetical protein [Nocardioides limicola]|uniref:hypothetical protein n=1 Tax=Nocardioides limicola TaxID=2803368 RepID=UPI00193BFD28|nr:hypothetical protein [Nocardioides sp. DJM-14]
MHHLPARLHARILGRDERGDVPGWVLITIMTVALVVAIWAVAETELRRMLSDALNSVR